ncbi:Type II secretion system protein [Lentibacillus sp. JNUCC-1]|uniref:type II secretion system F family protein n=1 Tax=Lentibacillus sp. JNUCC-1 TaxID=2654513 RepID=UPI0012E95B79|nr:type II secretion system F family protein [Lentibacillus sp. JNUCC-1]MUV36828.1 Type II secretion system protein [Lentibacillus sp. JNUCC-1]
MNFQYTGKRLSGQRVKGKIEAETEHEALTLLEKNGLVIVDIAETKPWNKDIIVNRKLKNADFVIFLRQYATLINAGISISEATKTMAKQTNNHALKLALEDIDKHLDKGESLSVAASEHPNIFPELLVNMIYAGEASGKLDEILNQMADYYEKEHTNRRKLISALMYPGIVGIITVFLTIFLLVFIVPQFVSMFQSFGEEIPAFTQLVLSLSDVVSAYWWIAVILIVPAVLIYKYVIQFPEVAYQVDLIKIRFPFLGQLAHKAVLVRMTQTMSTLVNSSVPILQAMEITERVVGNRVMQDVLRGSRESLEIGESITRPMQGHWAFPPLIVQMMQIGEKTGTLDHMLQKAADFYEEELEQLSNRIKTLIEPLMIIVLTVIVGSVIMAVVIPMFSLFENIQ